MTLRAGDHVNWTLRPGKDPDADPHYPGHGHTLIEDGDMIFERDVAVELRDGTTIYIDVFRPKAEGRYPVVLGYAPFGKHPHIDWDTAFPGADIPPGNSKYTAFEAPDPVVWTKAGFVIVNVDPRGIGYSEGIAQFMTEQEGRDDLRLRVAVQPGGCSGLRYQLYFDDKSLDGDQAKDFDGVKVVTDRMSAPYLMGATIDFVDTIEKQGFTIDNPNAQGSCACGDSFN